ncbi:PPE family protein [Mycobacterium sp. Aquia_213]|uniref:PPE family protein n=1 Tax=Mycobacterium sp. Aquia_213 TaxID=2991728 RepID=UPI002270E159|nr:PPE family protein [Mycobacterium sp. Aquia_213]WAC94095.1 PPE family protein [Mycobacterium sp. Aquia_213]
MDYGAVPPEITSALIYTGPGSGPLMAAAAGWDGLSAELATAASGYSSVVSELTSGPWIGPASSAMVSAVSPFVGWLSGVAAQAEETATQARAAAAAFEAVFTATVPPPVIAANRVLLANLIATNFFGQNTPAIAVTETQYLEMWAQDAGAMYGYAAASATATELPPFTSSPQTTTPDGTADQALAVSKAASEPAGQSGQSAANATTQVGSTNAVPQAAQQLSTNATAAADPSATATDPPWWSNWFTIPTPDNPMGWGPNVPQTIFKQLSGLPYFGTGLGSFGYSIQQQTTFGIGTTAGASGAWYPTPQFSGLAALGGGHPGGVAATAHLASSAKVGGLSVPSTWAGAAPAAVEEQAIQATMVNYATSAAGPANNGLLQGMPMTGAGRRAAAGFTHKYGFKRNVLVRPPSAG